VGRGVDDGMSDRACWSLYDSQSPILSFKCLLCRLKQQLMTEQEEEEEKLRWRVDAEVKLALEEFQKAEAQRGAGNQGASYGSIVLRLQIHCMISALLHHHIPRPAA